MYILYFDIIIIIIILILMTALWQLIYGHTILVLVTLHFGDILTHWGRVTHICVSRLTITGSDNSLSPGRRQAVIWTNAEILLIGPLGTNFIEILIEIHTFSFKKMHLKMSSGKWRPFCLGLNVLTRLGYSLLAWRGRYMDIGMIVWGQETYVIDTWSTLIL